MTTPVSNPHHSSFQRTAFLLILGLITLGFVFMIRHFLLTLFLAGVFAGLSYPLYLFLSRKMKRRIPASLTTLLILLLVLVLPATAVIIIAYQQAWVFFTGVDYQSLPGRVDGWVRELQQRFPLVFDQLNINRQEITGYAIGAVQNLLEWFLRQGANITLIAATGLLNFFLMLFYMFYFYLDGERILERMIRLSPLPDEYERDLLRRFLVVGRGTLKGIFVIGAVQGALCALLFWIVGVSSPVFLGVIAVFASIIPAFGVGLVWFPVAVVLLLTGKIVGGLVVLAVGATVISVTDNLLRPKVVGQDIKMHDVMVLVSTLGGLVWFGLPGFIIGPILAALFLSGWSIFEKMFDKELSDNRDRIVDSKG